MKQFKRTLHQLSMNGTISIGLDHFLAMFPATVLVPVLINNRVGTNVVDVSLVLLSSGLGTLLFLIATKGKVPAYLGSSFAYIGFSVYWISSMQGDDVTPQMAYIYVCWAYAFSGIILFASSFLYRIDAIDSLIKKILPASVLGPSISLIGLGMADMAAIDSGFIIGGTSGNKAIAIATLLIIILLSVTKRKLLKNTHIFLGMVLGCLLYFVFVERPEFDMEKLSMFSEPALSFPFLTIPPNLLGLFLSVLPVTALIFAENMSRVKIISGMKYQNKEEEIIVSNSLNDLSVSLKGHSFSILLASLMGSVPNTLYAENIAVMSINNKDVKDSLKPDGKDLWIISQIKKMTSFFPYIFAAFFAIIVSTFGFLQELLSSIPDPVIGGVELFLFGIIAAPGIQLLVDEKVNYKKISNQILTASVLVAGISGISLDLKFVEFSGMGLGLIVGIALNFIFMFLSYFNVINEAISFGELFCLCVNSSKEQKIARVGALKQKASFPPEPNQVVEQVAFNNLPSSVFLSSKKNNAKMSIADVEYDFDVALEMINNASFVEFSDDLLGYVLYIRRTETNLYLCVHESKLPERIVAEFRNDYPKSIENNGDYIYITIDNRVPLWRIKEIISIIVIGRT